MIKVYKRSNGKLNGVAISKMKVKRKGEEMNISLPQALEMAKPYGVTAISLGGCIEGSPIHEGSPGAMRRSGHAHNSQSDPNYGCICFKAHSFKGITPTLYWHEVAHIWRHSWTQAQCDKWAWRQARSH